MNYAVETSDVADAEIEAIFLSLAGRNPEFAGRWLEGLNRQIDTLILFPNRCPRVAENDLPGREIRKLLYRNGRTVYQILFILVNADDDGEPDTVRVLHVRHGARQPFGQPSGGDEP